MRQLSTLELELIIGGYDQDAQSRSLGDSSITFDAEGNGLASVSANDINAINAELQIAEITIPPITIPVDLPGGAKFSFTTPKITLSKKKK